MHFPSLHWPFSKQTVLSIMGGLLGHSAEVPVHLDSCSQVASWASRHLIPSIMNWQCWQQGVFLSLQTAPWFRLNLQFLSQHGSSSSMRPASHSSSPSTLKFPQNDSSGSEKHLPDLACKTLRIDRRLQGENLWKNKQIIRHKIYFFPRFRQINQSNTTLLLTSYPLTLYVYIK